MKLNEIAGEISKFDQILIDLCKMVVSGQIKDDYKYGMVAACVLDQEGNRVCRLNHDAGNQHRIHAERAAIDAYKEKHGDLPEGVTIITTLSPCANHMHDRQGRSCTDLINDQKITQVYCGYIDPTQVAGSNKKRRFKVKETQNEQIRHACKEFAMTFI